MDDREPLTTVEKAAILIDVDIFHEVPSDALAELAARMDDAWHAPDDVLVEPGGVEARLSVVVSGVLKVVRGTRTVCEVRAGQTFGLLASIGLPHDDQVIAVSECRVLSVSSDDYLDALADSIAFALSSLRALGRRLQACEQGVSSPAPAGADTP